jgi:hypothetical protein
MVTVGSFVGVKRRGVKLTTHLPLAAENAWSDRPTSTLHTSSWLNIHSRTAFKVLLPKDQSTRKNREGGAREGRHHEGCFEACGRKKILCGCYKLKRFLWFPYQFIKQTILLSSYVQVCLLQTYISHFSSHLWNIAHFNDPFHPHFRSDSPLHFVRIRSHVLVNSIFFKQYRVAQAYLLTLNVQLRYIGQLA